LTLFVVVSERTNKRHHHHIIRDHQGNPAALAPEDRRAGVLHAGVSAASFEYPSGS
jgi:hypothetical protein